MLVIAGEPLTRCFLAADALQDPPRLTGGLRISGRSLELIRARECPSIQKYSPRRLFSEEIACNFQHDCHAEIILLGGIFNISDREERGPNLVLIENSAAELRDQRPAERALAGAGESGHEDQHGFEDS